MAKVGFPILFKIAQIPKTTCSMLQRSKFHRAEVRRNARA